MSDLDVGAAERHDERVLRALRQQERELSEQVQMLRTELNLRRDDQSNRNGRILKNNGSIVSLTARLLRGCYAVARQPGEAGVGGRFNERRARCCN